MISLLKSISGVIVFLGLIIFSWGMINIFAGNSKGGSFFGWAGFIILAIGGVGVYIFDYLEKR